MSGFKKFLLRGNVVEIAVGIVIGVAFTALVTQFVGSFVTPIIAAIGGKPDFASLHFTINHSAFTYGAFINVLISFLLIAAAVYFFVVLPINVLLEKYKPMSDEPIPVKDCPECLSSIPEAARKCAYCSSVQKA